MMHENTIVAEGLKKAYDEFGNEVSAKDIINGEGIIYYCLCKCKMQFRKGETPEDNLFVRRSGQVHNTKICHVQQTIRGIKSWVGKTPARAISLFLKPDKTKEEPKTPGPGITKGKGKTFGGGDDDPPITKVIEEKKRSYSTLKEVYEEGLILPPDADIGDYKRADFILTPKELDGVWFERSLSDRIIVAQLYMADYKKRIIYFIMQDKGKMKTAIFRVYFPQIQSTENAKDGDNDAFYEIANEIYPFQSQENETVKMVKNRSFVLIAGKWKKISDCKTGKDYNQNKKCLFSEAYHRRKACFAETCIGAWKIEYIGSKQIFITESDELPDYNQDE